MRAQRQRTVRLSQTVSPFGVGSILDIAGESLMATDISEWPYAQTTPIHIPRLQLALGVAELRSPPSVPSRPSKRAPGLFYQRFPRWLFCQNCRRMRYLGPADETGDAPVCTHCGGGLVPMRFVAVCTTRGHAMDVPWDRWAHSEPRDDDQRRCRAPNLLFETRHTTTSGLGSLRIRCTTCHAERDLAQLTARDSLRRIGVYCAGTQPWQHRSASCDARVEVLQRGATTLTLPETVSALDIPEPALPARDIESEIRAHRNFEDVRSSPTGPRADILIDLIVTDLGVPADIVRRLAAEPPGGDSAEQEIRGDLLGAEWDAFRQAIEHPDHDTGTPDFRVSYARLCGDAAASPLHQLLSGFIPHIVLAHRLREVRVLQGFRRYEPAADLVNADLGPRGRPRWLPAVESFGEGVLLAFDPAKVAEWETQDAVISRIDRLEGRRQSSTIGSRISPAAPRLVLLHTVAHLLMRQLAFSSGYSAASLRERVYAGEGDEAGILIYTAAGDAEGTLGGLVRQGGAPRLADTLLATLETASWCSADPVCRESPGQGLGSLNLAACHGCSLVAETSCERGNVLLDRTLVIGDDTVAGFFAPVLHSARGAAVGRAR